MKQEHNNTNDKHQQVINNTFMAREIDGGR